VRFQASSARQSNCVRSDYVIAKCVYSFLGFFRAGDNEIVEPLLLVVVVTDEEELLSCLCALAIVLRFLSVYLRHDDLGRPKHAAAANCCGSIGSKNVIGQTVPVQIRSHCRIPDSHKSRSSSLVKPWIKLTYSAVNLFLNGHHGALGRSLRLPSLRFQSSSSLLYWFPIFKDQRCRSCSWSL